MLINFYDLFKINSRFIVKSVKLACFFSSFVNLNALTSNNNTLYYKKKSNEVCRCYCCTHQYENNSNSKGVCMKKKHPNNTPAQTTESNAARLPVIDNSDQMMQSILEMNKALLASNDSVSASLSTKSIFKSLPGAIEVTLLLNASGSNSDEALNMIKVKKDNIQKRLSDLGFSRKQITFFDGDPKVSCYSIMPYFDIKQFEGTDKKLSDQNSVTEQLKKEDSNKESKIKQNDDQEKLQQNNEEDSLNNTKDLHENSGEAKNIKNNTKTYSKNNKHNKPFDLVYFNQNPIQFDVKSKVNVVATSIETFIKIVRLAKELNLEITAQEFGDKDYIDDYEKNIIRAMSWSSNLDKFLLLVDSMGLIIKNCKSVSISEPFRINNNEPLDNIIREIAEFNYDQADISELDFILRRISKTYCTNVHFDVVLGLKASNKDEENNKDEQKQLGDAVKAYQDEFSSEGMGYNYSYNK